ncbi:hypothetical protein DSCW_21620 [Desulfosarcina widdelii]|uniref:Hemerythrin-like domain-containing protein n=1 Tax=Desulfosarcina widdelii TaxID=947919 RepID=A0A5K7Z204_9BACT|nr:hypothetical protein DSCW_21620 [Desulfosarcina widdelii]
MLNKNDLDYNDICREALVAMHEYALTHFRFEEEYLEKINYPDIVKTLSKA